MEAYFKTKKRQTNSGEQEKESIICVRVGEKNPSLGITICHHSASLVMPNDDPRDGFFYPTLTLRIDSYRILQELSCLSCSNTVKPRFDTYLDEDHRYVERQSFQLKYTHRILHEFRHEKVQD